MTTTMTTLQRRHRQSMMLSSLVVAAALVLASTSTITVTTAFVMIAPTPTNTNTIHRGGARRTMPNASSSSRLYDTIVSPFDNEGSGDSDATTTTAATPSKLEGPLDLTWDNVEAVLDEMRPFLIQDGGNVIIQDIDGPVVRLELQGNCGSCPSSTQTMKMGLERGLKEKIPEIQEVIQALPEGPPLEDAQIEVVLDGVRPFLQVAGGTIDIDRIDGVGGLQPTVWLTMQGSSASLNSVKLEIAQRLQRHFMMPGLRIEWTQDVNSKKW